MQGGSEEAEAEEEAEALWCCVVEAEAEAVVLGRMLKMKMKTTLLLPGWTLTEIRSMPLPLLSVPKARGRNY